MAQNNQQGGQQPHKTPGQQDQQGNDNRQPGQDRDDDRKQAGNDEDNRQNR